MKAEKKPQPIKPISSCDAPPLDFSFRNVRYLEQILSMKPQQGKRKPIVAESEESKKQDKESEPGSRPQSKPEEEVIDKPTETKLEIVRHIEVSTLIAAQTLQNQSKSKNEPVELQKKTQLVELTPSTLYLSYNKLRSIKTFHPIVNAVFPAMQNLRWIDLSHNQLIVLDYDFKDLPMLKTLYLHCNFIKDFAEIQKLAHLQELRGFTIHANPLENHPHFRNLIIALLPQVNKIDSALVTKRQTETASYFIKQANFKKLPIVPNAPQPKSDSEDGGDG